MKLLVFLNLNNGILAENEYHPLMPSASGVKMKIEKNVVVSLADQVKTEEGVVVDQSTVEAPLDYLHGHNNLIVGLEKALEGKVEGDKFSITVTPEDAYGEHMDEMVQRVPANVFQGVDQIEVGMRFLADTDQGPIPVEVTEVDGDEVVVIGGGQLYEQLLPKADVLYLTMIALDVEGDTVFPEWDDGSWKIENSETATNDKGLQYSFNTFVKKC